jgi:hypothetical protein
MKNYRKSQSSMYLLRKSVAALVVVVMLAVWCCSATAAPVFFTDRATFDAATGGGLSFESFENPWSTSATVVFSGFSVSELNGNNQIHYQGISSTYISAVTDGSGACVYQDNGNSIGMFFAFNNPTYAIGMDITVNPVNTLVIDIGGGVTDTLAFSTNNSPKFWGVISDSVIDTITFDGVATGSANYIGFDAVSYGVPEPATICLLGLGALSLLRRKR